MADQKPPRLVGNEREVLCDLLQFQRESLARKLSGVSDDDARRQLVPSGTTLLWLARHMASAEMVWVLVRFAGEAVESPAGDGAPDDTISSAVADYEACWRRVDKVVRGSSLDDECRNVGDEAQVNLRWILAHLLEETARHAGHADIIREQIDGSTGR